jgi:hypothetical protein
VILGGGVVVLGEYFPFTGLHLSILVHTAVAYGAFMVGKHVLDRLR